MSERIHIVSLVKLGQRSSDSDIVTQCNHSLSDEFVENITLSHHRSLRSLVSSSLSFSHSLSHSRSNPNRLSSQLRGCRPIIHRHRVGVTDRSSVAIAVTVTVASTMSIVDNASYYIFQRSAMTIGSYHPLRQSSSGANSMRCTFISIISAISAPFGLVMRDSAFCRDDTEEVSPVA